MKERNIKELLLRGTISDAIRKAYDMVNKSIILPDELDEEMLYLYNKYRSYALDNMKLSLERYNFIWDMAVQIADMYEGRYL